jgi:P4 family phage/plasmid primase-like protien
MDTEILHKPKQTHKKETYENFMKRHAVGTGGGEITHTSMKGGKYYISDNEYPEFMKLYSIHIKKKPEFLTEKQLPDNGPIAIDIDLRFTYDTVSRQYQDCHIDELIGVYLEEINRIYHFDDEDNEFPIFLYEKATVNRVKEKNYTKDGIHIIIGIKADRVIQQWLRQRIMERMQTTNWTTIGITNPWDEILDEGITKGCVNWQLHGSRKPDHEPYHLTRVFQARFDEEEESLLYDTIDDFNIDQNMAKLSVRYQNHISPLFKTGFAEEFKSYKEEIEEKKKSNSAAAGGAAAGATGFSFHSGVEIGMDDILAIRSAEQLAEAIRIFVEAIPPAEYHLREAYEYTMVLPPAYYGPGSYLKWLHVGWALRNIHKCLFVAWLAMSAQSSEFQFSQIGDLYDKWRDFNPNPRGLTLRSILYWAKTDNPTKYEEIRENSIDYHIESVLNIGMNDTGADGKVKITKCGDFDIANILYLMYKDEFVCTNLKNNIWYQFENHRWHEIDSGVKLREKISSELHAKFYEKQRKIVSQVSAAKGNNNESLHEALHNIVKKIGTIMEMLRRNFDKKNIMREAADLFYDSHFMNNLDENLYLLCFSNGVFDFKPKNSNGESCEGGSKEKIEGYFRPGRPEDRISKCTNIPYVPIDLENPEHVRIVAEIKDFMGKLFPKEKLRQYMWEHLASTLIGGNMNQTYNNYLGIGQNGKSVLIGLMEKIMGEYKADAPLSLITEKRVQTGGVSPEIVGLKGIRYAVMQEPSQGDQIKEGMLKQITGCDNIQGRALFTNGISFRPQFKLVVCSNHLMTIKTRDHGTWRRVRIVDFMSLFTDNPVKGEKDKPYQFKLDRTINEKFDSWKTIFMSMLVEIAKEKMGYVTDCDIVMASTDEYRKKQDNITAFLDAKVMKKLGSKVKKTTINIEFTNWYQNTFNIRPTNTKELHEVMDKEYGKYSPAGWSNIAIIEDTDEADEEAAENDDSGIIEDVE